MGNVLQTQSRPLSEIHEDPFKLLILQSQAPTNPQKSSLLTLPSLPPLHDPNSVSFQGDFEWEDSPRWHVTSLDGVRGAHQSPSPPCLSERGRPESPLVFEGDGDAQPEVDEEFDKEYVDENDVEGEDEDDASTDYSEAYEVFRRSVWMPDHHHASVGSIARVSGIYVRDDSRERRHGYRTHSPNDYYYKVNRGRVAYTLGSDLEDDCGRRGRSRCPKASMGSH